MVTLPHRLRHPYRSEIPPVVQPWIVPGRHALLSYRHRWPPIRVLVVVTIVVLSAWPLRHTPGPLIVVGGALLAYLLWQFPFQYIEQRKEFATGAWRQAISILRYLGGVLAVLFLTQLYPQLAPQMWVLYLVPLLTIGVSLERQAVLPLILLTSALALLSSFPLQTLPATEAAWWMALREGALRGLITLYVGFSAYLLARCLAYQHRTNREAVDRLLEITTMTSWATSADTIAQIIADLFHDPRSPITANVLTYDPVSNQLQVIGSSTADGRQLASTNYDFPADRGISGWAARNMQPCFINDTHNDPEGRFLAHGAFPHTRSALAVPFLLDNDQVAVLEVESAHTSDFAQEDLQLLQMIGSHLVISHRRNQLLDLHRNLAILGQELAERIIHVDDIGVMLERVGEVSLQLLKADLVSFYFRHPITGEIRERRIVGKLKVEGAGGSPLTEHDSLVVQLMQAREPRFFQHAQQEPSLIRRRAWHEQVQHAPFVLREDILSCAAIPLVIGQECNGLMWVNYRHAKEFSEPLCNLIQLLAPYAAMAIQGGLRSALAEQERKNEARRMVHDSLAHRLRDMSRGMARLRECEPRSTSWSEEIHIVMLQLERAMHSVDNLVKQRANSTFALILTDLTVNANLIHMTYHLPVTLDLCEAPEIPISANAADELLFACDEILGNATRHAQATTISIKARQAHDTLIIEIADDGIGFDVSRVRPGQGVSNIRRRVVTLGGTANVISEPGAGTLVRLTVPLPRNGARILPL